MVGCFFPGLIPRHLFLLLVVVHLVQLRLGGCVVTSAQQPQRRRRLWPAAQVERYYYYHYDYRDDIDNDNLNNNNHHRSVSPPPSTTHNPLYTLSLSFQKKDSEIKDDEDGGDGDAARFLFVVECTNNNTVETKRSRSEYDNNERHRRCPRHVRSFLHKAQHRFYSALRKQQHQQRPPPSYTADQHYHHSPVQPLRGIRISLTSPPKQVGTLFHGVDESYTLTILPPHHPINATTTETNAPSSLYVDIVAPTVYGAMHGLQSLLQLLDLVGIIPNSYDDNEDVQGPSSRSSLLFAIHGAPLLIQDYPVYPYRGLMLDTGRHYLPVSLLRHTLDALEMNKLNVLHWHMTDSQSWPYQSQQYPELSNPRPNGGAYCPTCIYNQSDIRQVILEAADRGIQVVLELDLPGHCQSIGASHPEFLTLCGFRGPSEPLDVTRDDVWELVETLYSELDQLAGSHSWIHTGGDEVNFDCWKKSQSVQAWMQNHNMTNEKQLQQYFEARLLHHMTNTLHRTPIVWQEAFDAGGGLDLPPTTVVDVWKEWDTSARQTATLQGHPVLFSACWYLDHLSEDWKSFYKCDPRDFNATDGLPQLLRVKGGHASMWGERVDETNFDPRVWPRASATAERLWIGSPSTKAGQEAAATAEDRLDKFRCLLLQRGIQASPIRPGSCDDSPSLWTVAGDEDEGLFTTGSLQTS